METCVGFVRGINVGGAKRVAMADLRVLAENPLLAGAVTSRNWKTILRLHGMIARA